MMTLQFGKHKNRPLESVPVDYLNWVLDNCKISEELYNEILHIVALNDAYKNETWGDTE